MPKIRTRKAASKRFKFTGTGKVKYKKQGMRHILTKKNSKRKRQLRKGGVLCPAEERRVVQMLPGVK